MERFAPYIGIAAALFVGALFLLIGNSVSVLYTAPDTPRASSTLSVLPPIEIVPVTLPSIIPESVTAPVPSATTTAVAAPKKKASPPPVTTVVKTETPVADAPALPAANISAELDASASLLRAALVNIICYAPAGSGLRSISGSGVIIDEKGIILTNAHVAQYFLLADRGVSCTVRTGSPATDRYFASLVFISPAWISANATVLTQSNPNGTGQFDYALLAITKTATSAPLPPSFPAVSLATNPPTSGTPIVIASYGAQFLEAMQIQSYLFPTIVFGSVKAVYTFEMNTIDVIALGGSAAAQEGSSGGGVANASGKLIGTITTSTVEGATDTRELDAITASYIRADYATETGEPLDLLLAKPTATAIAEFLPQAGALEATLVAHLP